MDIVGGGLFRAVRYSKARKSPQGKLPIPAKPLILMKVAARIWGKAEEDPPELSLLSLPLNRIIADKLCSQESS